MANAHSLEALMKWLSREEWRQPFNELFDRHVGQACDDAGIAVEDVADTIGNENASTMWGCIFEDFLAFELDDDSNIVDDYLGRRGWKESIANKRYMTALRSSVMSLYEVSDVVRDQSFLARDLLRGGEPVRISEKSATHSLKQWDRIAARVVRMGPRFEMAGGVLAFSHEFGDTLREHFAAARKKMLADLRKSAGPDDQDVDPFDFDTAVLRHAGFLFTTIWLDDALQQTLDPSLPTLSNSDGDEMTFTTVRYPLKETCDRAALGAALTAMVELQHTGDDLWAWTGAAAPVTATAQGGDQVVTSIFSGGSLATVELEAEALKLETDSLQRAQRGQALLEPVIDRFVGEPVVEAQTAAEMLAASSAKERPEPPSGLAAEQDHAIIQQTLERHYRAVLDRAVPMLGNVSPREAAKTKKGREKLVAWLKFIENANAHHDPDSPMANYDVGWMWEELGIGHLRR